MFNYGANISSLKDLMCSAGMDGKVYFVMLSCYHGKPVYWMAGGGGKRLRLIETEA